MNLFFQFLPNKNEVSKLRTNIQNDFHIVDTYLGKFGCTVSKKNAIYMVLSGILNLGNIEFEPISDEDSCFVTLKSRNFLCNAAALLSINETELENALIYNTRIIGNQQIKYLL